ncbi:hypothetical protein CDAR_37191 [Caerostris darwini]|uniref:Uncharacterized protein n=1 Tax=Caerostris darwini TaxID=1538125 RepID=A0AAV4QQV1_9ARAC|nr:hypothetical protein CDAR_37191 [Caerostris darwini]
MADQAFLNEFPVPIALRKRMRRAFHRDLRLFNKEICVLTVQPYGETQEEFNRSHDIFHRGIIETLIRLSATGAVGTLTQNVIEAGIIF